MANKDIFEDMADYAIELDRLDYCHIDIDKYDSKPMVCLACGNAGNISIISVAAAPVYFARTPRERCCRCRFVLKCALKPMDSHRPIFKRYSCKACGKKWVY